MPPRQLDNIHEQLLKFLINKSNNSKPPLVFSSLSQEFKWNNECYLGDEALIYRIRRLSLSIHELEGVDMDTKVKLMFVLSVTVDVDFVESLKEHAEILETDDSRRIIEYKRGSLHLMGHHEEASFIGTSITKCAKFLNYLAETCKEIDRPISIKELIIDFYSTNGASTSVHTLEKHFNWMQKEIYSLEWYDKETRIRMMFVAGASVPECFLKELRKDAQVEVDDLKRITKYVAIDGSLKLAGSTNFPQLNRHQVVYKVEDKKLERQFEAQIVRYIRANEQDRKSGRKEVNRQIREAASRDRRRPKRAPRYCPWDLEDEEDEKPSSRASNRRAPTTVTRQSFSDLDETQNAISGMLEQDRALRRRRSNSELTFTGLEFLDDMVPMVGEHDPYIFYDQIDFGPQQEDQDFMELFRETDIFDGEIDEFAPMDIGGEAPVFRSLDVLEGPNPDQLCVDFSQEEQIWDPDLIDNCLEPLNYADPESPQAAVAPSETDAPRDDGSSLTKEQAKDPGRSADPVKKSEQEESPKTADLVEKEDPTIHNFISNPDNSGSFDSISMEEDDKHSVKADCRMDIKPELAPRAQGSPNVQKKFFLAPATQKQEKSPLVVPKDAQIDMKPRLSPGALFLEIPASSEATGAQNQEMSTSDLVVGLITTSSIHVDLEVKEPGLVKKTELSDCSTEPRLAAGAQDIQNPNQKPSDPKFAPVAQDPQNLLKTSMEDSGDEMDYFDLIETTPVPSPVANQDPCTELSLELRNYGNRFKKLRFSGNRAHRLSEYDMDYKGSDGLSDRLEEPGCAPGAQDPQNPGQELAVPRLAPGPQSLLKESSSTQKIDAHEAQGLLSPYSAKIPTPSEGSVTQNPEKRKLNRPFHFVKIPSKPPFSDAPGAKRLAESSDAVSKNTRSYKKIKEQLAVVERGRNKENEHPEPEEAAEESDSEIQNVAERQHPYLQVLQALRDIVVTLDLASVSSVQKKIEAKIKQPTNLRIPPSALLLGFDSCLHMVLKNSASELPPDQEKASLANFLSILRSSILDLGAASLEMFQKKLKGIIRDLSVQDRYFPVTNLLSSVEMALDIFSP